MTNTLNIRVVEPAITVVEISGRLTLGNALTYAETSVKRIIAEGSRKIVIDLAGGRMRLAFASRTFTLPAGSELHARDDLYGSALLWPNRTSYTVLPPGALRSVLSEQRADVVPLVRALESAAIAACVQFGVHGERSADHAGVFVGNNQLCAIGLAVRKMTSMHGIALNVSNDLNYDSLINPCGLIDRGLTSLSKETGRIVSISDARDALLDAFAHEFSLEWEHENIGVVA